jgi:hypothetical protein
VVVCPIKVMYNTFDSPSIRLRDRATRVEIDRVEILCIRREITDKRIVVVVVDSKAQRNVTASKYDEW